MKSTEHSIAVVIPAYNEEKSIPILIDQLDVALKNTAGHVFTYLFINDGSTDNTLAVLEENKKRNKHVEYINLSRNFGKEAALTAGICGAVNYDAVVMMDADGQHPPKVINEFIEKWHSGHKIVIGKRLGTDKKSLFRHISSLLFNKILGLLTSKGQSESGATDFRLLDKQVVIYFSQLSERNRITRGLIDWMGFQRTYVEFNAPARIAGTATYSTRMLMRLALHAFTSNSSKPLKFVGILGMFVSLVTLLLEIVLLILMYVFNDPLDLNISGTFHLGILTAFMIGIVLSCQGLVALYIENIYKETQGRPLYLVDQDSRSNS